LAKFGIVRCICLYNALLGPVCTTSYLNHVFLVAGCWVSVDFDSKYKILWDETRAHRVPIHEEEKKFKTRIYIISAKFQPPYNIRMTQVGVEGETHTVPPSRL